MHVTTSANAGRPAGRRVVRPAWIALLVASAVVPLEAQQSRRAPRFEGPMIPQPPSQDQPWTVPATTLPKFLTTATGILFEQGVADPRGCEYRQVEVGNFSIVKGHGFVLPERKDAPGRFVVGWDGLVYPALSVGAPADLDRDINELAAHLKRTREAGEANRFGRGVSWGFPANDQDDDGLAGVDDHSPVKLCLLLRLGRADLAEALFAAGTAWTPGPRGRDLTDYGMSYLTLAVDWAASAFRNLIGAHVRGDDVVALDAARKLARFRDLATARADAMGFPVANTRDQRGLQSPARFYFLSQLDVLLRDHERRAKMPPRGPIPAKGGDPATRIAALVRDLDQIDEQQEMSPGAADPGSSPMVSDLVAEGDPAVAPLLAVLESDNRLTRSVTHGRGSSVEQFVHPVYEAAFAGLVRILKTSEFENHRIYAWSTTDAAEKKKLAASMRQFWEKTRSVPLVERWYRTLLDDDAGSARWLEAAGGIVLPPIVKEGMPFARPGTRPFQGESLRNGRDPSVTALMIRRAGQIEARGTPNTSPYDERGFAGTCRMGEILALWDEKAALPLLQSLCKECRARSDQWRAQENPQNADQNLASYLARFTLIRDRLGDDSALDEYAAWLRTTSPKMLEYGTFEALQPLLARPDHPAMASAARWLFNDPKSPWVPLLPEARGDLAQPFRNLFASPLIVVAGFREGVLAGLADKTPLGTFERDKGGSTERKIPNVPTLHSSSSNLDLEGFAAGVVYPFRRCDDLASKLSELEGCPRIQLFWPEARRDEAVAACVAYLKRFGGRFTAEAPPRVFDTPGPKAHLRFPTLGKPATQDDVAAARAIFSLEGEGETRLVKLPGFPQQARWVTLKDSPVTRTYYPGAIVRHEFDTDGFVWQAEEVHKGDRWERYYGFVGHHVVARAPAAEIEFAGQFGPWSNLPGGLDARLELIEPQLTRFEPGRPIVVTAQIRNRLGVAHPSPTELLRLGPDGKAALRNGVNPALWYTSERRQATNPNRGYPQDVIEPKRTAHFAPGDAARTLAPLEAFEALRFDPHDWFDLTRPGTYRLRLTFTAESGLGEGGTNDLIFEVGAEE